MLFFHIFLHVMPSFRCLALIIGVLQPIKPQSNGLCERYKQTLCNSLVKYVNDKQDDWDEFIEPALLAYPTTVQKSIGKTPFFLAFGKEPRLLIEDKYPVGGKAVKLDEETALDNRIRAIANLLSHQKTAKSSIQHAQEKQKQYF